MKQQTGRRQDAVTPQPPSRAEADGEGPSSAKAAREQLKSFTPRVWRLEQDRTDANEEAPGYKKNRKLEIKEIMSTDLERSSSVLQRAPSQHLGPEYRATEQKPSATVSTEVSLENVHILPQTAQLIALLTMLRDENTSRADFIFYSNRINRLLVEEALNHLPVLPQTVTTPVGRTYAGVKFEGKICGVSIMRAGEAMEQALRECCRSVRIGKILIQRDEETSKPRLFYDKLPEDIRHRWVLLLDPMLATGGSALMAIDVLRTKGVPEDHILFLNLIAAPEGAANFAQKYPKVRIVTAFVDQGLNEKNYIIPGLGDFGDRFYTL